MAYQNKNLTGLDLILLRKGCDINLKLGIDQRLTPPNLPLKKGGLSAMAIAPVEILRQAKQALRELLGKR